MNPQGTCSRPRALFEAYRAAIEQHGLNHDPNQRAVIESLAELARALDEAGPIRHSIWNWMKPRAEVTGLYLWGGVGVGKTFLMDLFFFSLPFDDKKRLHFHRFMRHVHAGLNDHMGPDPLKHLAANFAANSRLLCFDEFHVSDIGDAMILGGMLQALFDEGVTVVATSNLKPDDLYRDGLQRARFVPAIDAIKAHCGIAELKTGVDYRLRSLRQAKMYYATLDAESSNHLARAFESLAGVEHHTNEPLHINGRELPVVCRAEGVVWFEFELLCAGPRSVADYVELSLEYHSLLLGNVPIMREEDNNAARRFISLVDECYECSVKIIMTAAAPISELYCGRRLAFEFERTKSRLIEMQSQQYLARAHLAQ